MLTAVLSDVAVEHLHLDPSPTQNDRGLRLPLPELALLPEKGIIVVAIQANALRAPGVGVAVVVWEDHSRRRLLVGLGHNADDKERVYAVPGGHWESGESLVDAIRRETIEEAGISIDQLELTSVYEFHNPEKRKSYVTIGFQAVLAAGTPQVMEPENKSDWNWYTIDEALSLPLFPPDKVLIERADSGVMYDAG